MRVLVYGAGAVGGYFGGRLAQSGADVTLLARGAHLTALQMHGITLHSVDGDFQGPVQAVAQLQDAPPPELVLLCVKAHQTGQAAAQLAGWLPAGCPVLPLQNGLGHLQVLARQLNQPRLVAACVFIGARVGAPGVIDHTAAGLIRLGTDPTGVDAHAEAVARFLSSCNIKVKTSPTIRRDMWKKLLWNVGFNGPSALAGATVGELLASPEQTVLIRSLMAEAAAVASAEGHDLGPEIVERTFAQTEGLNDFKTSMLQDREAGRPLESDAFYGHLVREGQRLGVVTPTLARLQAQLQDDPEG